MKTPIERLKYDLDQGDFDPHIFRQSIHSSIWDLVQEIKLTPEEDGFDARTRKTTIRHRSLFVWQFAY
jgi:hypothetical protein